MNKREYGIIVLFVLCLVLVAGYAGAIGWIQYNERLVGEGSSTYPNDVLNRPAKQIWGIYTSQHTTLGGHKPGSFPTPQPTATPPTFPTPLPTATPAPLADYVTASTFQTAHKYNGAPRDTYLVSPEGTGNLASGTFAPAGFFTGTNAWGVDNNQWTIVALINYYDLNRAESFYQHIETRYSLNVLNFGKNSGNKLSLTLGAATWTSTTTFFDTLNEDMPIEVAVVCDKTAGTMVFCVNGVCEAAITGISYASWWPSILEQEQHVIGAGFKGAIRLLGVSHAKLFAPNSTHAPITTLAQLPQPLVYYDPARNDDAFPTLTDQVYWLSGYAANHSLTVNAQVGNGFPTW